MDLYKEEELVVEKINNVKERLQKELDKEKLDKGKILEISKELDKIIIKYYNNNKLVEREKHK